MYRHTRWLLIIPVSFLFVSCIEEKNQQSEEIALVNGNFQADLNGFQISYEVHGSGPVLMVVPNSWGVTIPTLRQVYKGLEKRLTMVYFDPRGMGRSDPIQQDSDMGLESVRKDFDALRRHLGLDKVFAAGWSNGAVNLIQLADNYPENLSALVFIHGLATYSNQDNEIFAKKYPEIMESYLSFFENLANETISDQEKNDALKKFWLDELFPLSCADRENSRELLYDIFSQAELSWRHLVYASGEVPVIDLIDQLSQINKKAESALL